MACIFVDVDGTISESAGTLWGAGRPEVIRAVRRAVNDGHEVVICSANGGAYACEYADAYDMPGVTCVSKPDFIVDDWACENKPRIRPDDKLTILSPEEFAEGSWRK